MRLTLLKHQFLSPVAPIPRSYLNRSTNDEEMQTVLRNVYLEIHEVCQINSQQFLLTLEDSFPHFPELTECDGA